MKLVNLTPHRLVVLDAAGGTVLALPPCPRPPRIEQLVIETTVLEEADVPLDTIRYGKVSRELPAPEPGVLLVVPRVLAREVLRDDLVFPDREVRDADGRIIACRTLARFATDR